MKKINNKGFSLIELLSVMVILGIIMTLSVAAYNTYRKQARQKAYDTMAESAKNAATEYLINYPYTSKINFDELVLGEYLDNTTDPRNNNNTCVGTVTIEKNAATGNALETNDFKVSMCCERYNYTYQFPGGKKVEDKGGCAADDNIAKFVEKEDTECVESKTKKKKIDLYSMDYLTKTCTRGANGHYGVCGNTPRPSTVDADTPCRTYQYHLRKCECTYNKTTHKLCSSKILDEGADNHVMKVRYQDNEQGHAACESTSQKYVNSYVQSVCSRAMPTDSDQLTFHGYIFYKGLSKDLRDFDPDGSWFHSASYYEKRVPKSAYINGQPDYEQGCRDTCIKLTEEWSGKVD